MELTIAGVGTRLGGRWVVDGVDATPPTGALTGLLGPNGAGKTTLLRLVAGLLVPQAGAVMVSDDEPGPGPTSTAGAAGAVPPRQVPVHLLPRRHRARRIALLEQESSSAVPLTVRDVVALGRIPYRSWWGTDDDPAAVDRALEAAEAAHLADRAWATLSGGERQRVQIARALAQEPALLLLDEPTNHLDVAAQLHLLAFVRNLGTTTVAALHDLNLAAAFCEHVLVLSAGRLAAAGHPADVLTPALLRQVYGVEAEVLTHPRTGRPVIAFTDRSPVGPTPRPQEDR
ncbi:MAG: histidinol phosphatase [Cellulomonas sp. 73-145]|uniref:putative F420-0 ABC transporter ATP-binding protein n=1 Tax=Cellulomonas sp. 73-145 TaxID=1895739 RepID=UPI00092A97DE|nr:putative F420-0 ABC transporter ATP-binding protein [Cellulomonas sp. 73-145]MBN9325925.1 ATP-binding cassette domain-containing protein [Cellulomonas sp.]OJV59607.1 MAG: histidinol phosphatase [Cellulomonas sp. 73-145]